jgi:hypothetical protein
MKGGTVFAVALICASFGSIMLLSCKSTPVQPEQPEYIKIPMTLDMIDIVGGKDRIKKFQYYISSKVELGLYPIR